MNSDLKAQLRELNITAAKVGQTFSAKTFSLICCVFNFCEC